MTKLVTLKAYQARYNVPDDSALNAKLSASIDAATLYVAEYIRTPGFDRIDGAADNFNLPSKGTEMYNPNEWVFMLRQGLVEPESVVVKLAYDRASLSGAPEVENRFIFVDSDRGLVKVKTEFLEEYTSSISYPFTADSEKYVQISFNAGLIAVDKQLGPEYQDVPAWLAEAAIQQANILQQGSCSKGTGISTAQAMVGRLIASKIRYAPYAMRAL